MNDSIQNTFFLKTDSIESQKSKSFSKDLFSQKLGHANLFTSTLNKRQLPSIKKHKFSNNITTIPKNNTNILLSTDKDDDLSHILNKLNIPFVPQKNSYWSNENNKQSIMKSKTILSDFNYKGKYNKKELKEMMNLKQKQTKLEINEKTSEQDKKEVFKKKFLEAISHANIRKNFIKKENSKEILGFEYKLIENKKRSSKNNNNNNDNKFRNRSQEKINKISICAISNNTNKNGNNNNDKESIVFLSNFYESFIELYQSYDNNNYIKNINDFNQTYFFLFDLNAFPKTNMNNKFLDIFKYSSILIICLVFLSKDEILYKNTFLKMKELLEIFILLSLNSLDYKILGSKKIKDFVELNKALTEGKTLIETLNNIISLLFNDKMNDYKKLRKCLKQLTNNINEDTPEKVLTIVNDVLLFCHNCSYFIEEAPTPKKDKKKKSHIDKKDDDKSSNKSIQTPFIKKKMEKKFCLVIDLDETLIHNLNLPFGEYFFVRPGLFDFLEKIHEIYEIIIFTAGQKNYAYSIIDKIDCKNYISFILYKKHVIYEDGFPVKKLDLIGRDLKKVIYVDNLEKNAKYNKENYYMISSWYNNIYDNELDKLKEKMVNIATCGKYDNDITKGLIQN